jgi:ribosomal protein S1
MSWGRINHPSEMLKIGQKVEVKVLNIDREKEKIALGLKQREASPWEEIEKKYPVGSRVRGAVVNIMSYGAFVRLEDGIEGLVHISEMSWTRRVNHPSEIVQPNQEVDVVVLEINKDKQEISLGMKQTEVNPWELVSEKYPPGTIIEGKVRNLANYGAFVEIEPGIDGLLHISDMSWTKKVTHPNEMLKKGDSVKCVVLEVDREKQRISLGIKQLTEDPWLNAIPEHYKPGMVVRGKVTKITNFGVFVELEPTSKGLLHISELADHKVENPQDVVKAGDEIDVKILRVDKADRKIGLSLKRAQWGDTTQAPAEGGEGQEAPRPQAKPRPAAAWTTTAPWAPTRSASAVEGLLPRRDVPACEHRERHMGAAEHRVARDGADVVHGERQPQRRERLQHAGDARVAPVLQRETQGAELGRAGVHEQPQDVQLAHVSLAQRGQKRPRIARNLNTGNELHAQCLARGAALIVTGGGVVVRQRQRRQPGPRGSVGEERRRVGAVGRVGVGVQVAV